MLAEIQEREFVSVGELSSRFGVSEVTVRGDLDSLAATFNSHAVPRLFRMNNMPTDKLPALHLPPVPEWAPGSICARQAKATPNAGAQNQ